MILFKINFISPIYLAKYYLSITLLVEIMKIYLKLRNHSSLKSIGVILLFMRCYQIEGKSIYSRLQTSFNYLLQTSTSFKYWKNSSEG